MEIAELADVPFYNGDLSDKPAAVSRVLAQLDRADALVLACPEYNYLLAPVLKNILDWASREPNNAVLADKAVAIMGAGGGMGTSRAQHHLRQVCVFLNLHPLNKAGSFRQRVFPRVLTPMEGPETDRAGARADGGIGRRRAASFSP